MAVNILTDGNHFLLRASTCTHRCSSETAITRTPVVESGQRHWPELPKLGETPQHQDMGLLYGTKFLQLTIFLLHLLMNP